MADIENLQKGNSSYSKGDWDGAISYYTKAIKINPNNDTFYCNRSAAYLKTAEYQNALKDASNCILLNAKSHKGYGRKGAAYHAMKKYDLAIATFKEGIDICPEQEHLHKGLSAAKRAAAENSKAKKALRKTEATKRATKSRTKRAKDAEDVSDFVKQTRQELKLQMAALQSQLDLINELAAMEENEKLELLFTLIDADGDGTVDAKELAAAMRKRNDELSFQEAIENSIDMVATFDEDGDAKLDMAEFRNYINVMLKELGVSFADFSEFLVIQILFSDNKNGSDSNKKDTTSDEKDTKQSTKTPGNKSPLALKDKNIEDEVKAREVLFDMLADERMVELFRLFDIIENRGTKGGGDVISFEDVAVALYVHVMENMRTKKKNSTSTKRLRTAYTLLLMMDKKDKRTLNYEQFGRLIMAFVAVDNMSFDDVADDLTIALATKDQRQDCALADQLAESLFLSDSIYQITRDINNEYSNTKIKNRRSSLDSATTSTSISSSRSQSTFADSSVGTSSSSSPTTTPTPTLTTKQLLDPLTFGRLSKLFQLWDADGDGDLTFKELTDGLRKFQKAAGIDTCRNAKNDAKALFDFDQDGNNSLDTKEFAIAIVHFARAHNDVAIHDLIDFMCVTSVMGKENSKKFQEAYGRALGKDVLPKLKSLNAPKITSFILEDD